MQITRSDLRRLIKECINEAKRGFDDRYTPGRDPDEKRQKIYRDYINADETRVKKVNDLMKKIYDEVKEERGPDVTKFGRFGLDRRDPYSKYAEPYEKVWSIYYDAGSDIGLDDGSNIYIKDFDTAIERIRKELDKLIESDKDKTKEIEECNKIIKEAFQECVNEGIFDAFKKKEKFSMDDKLNIGVVEKHLIDYGASDLNTLSRMTDKGVVDFLIKEAKKEYGSKYSDAIVRKAAENTLDNLKRKKGLSTKK